MTLVEAPDLRSRFRGCVLGVAVGDAMGLPFEAVDSYGIYLAFGSTANIVANPPVEELAYSDDTQMTIALADTLVVHGTVREDIVASSYGRYYDPGRGHGQGAKRVLQAIRDGDDWRAISLSQFPGGSFGNGAAMRAAPVGLMFHRDLDRLEREAETSALPTHRHPMGIDGARVIALAVAMALQPDLYNRVAFFSELYARAQAAEFKTRIEQAALSDSSVAPATFGNTIEAQNSAVTAVVCYDQNRDSYQRCLASAIRCGGDVDTIAAMAGGISGAALGLNAIPSKLLTMLENGQHGRDYIDRIAVSLHDRFVSDNPE